MRTNPVKCLLATLFATLLIAPTLAAAASGCPKGTVLVGEDADNYYCKDRAEFSKCVKEAGEQLAQLKPVCAQVAGDCFRASKMGLTTGAVSCALGCRNGGFLANACIASCAPALIQSAWVYDACVTKGYDCFDDRLKQHKQSVERCRE